MKKYTNFGLLILCLFLLSCASDKQAEWTILVYMAADNSLTEQAVQDIIEMERAKVTNEINVIVQLDPRATPGLIEDPQARRYKITHNFRNYIASPVLEYLGEIDSGDYLSMVDFVNWGIRKYPAKKYSLFIWSHGTGWSRDGSSQTRGICPDQSSFNQISIAKGQLRRAFEMFSQKIDILLIDACLMFSMELLTEVYHRTNYVIGSENMIPYEGFPYQEILEHWNYRMSSEVIASRIVDLYAQSHLPGGSQNPHEYTREITASVMKSRYLPQLLDLLADFTTEWQSDIYLEYIESARNDCHGFHIGRTEVDLKEFMVNLNSSVSEIDHPDLDELLKAIDAAFVAQVSYNLPFNTGTASVWFPEYADYFAGSREMYSNLTFPQITGWEAFLQWFFKD